MDNNNFKGFKLPEIEVPNVAPVIESMNSKIQDHLSQIAEQHFKEENYKNEVLQTLKNIEANTVGLTEIIPLLSSNTSNQEKLLEVLTEALSIGTATTEAEARTKYRTFMDSASQTVEDVETMEKLLGFGKTIYHTAITYLKFKMENGG